MRYLSLLLLGGTSVALARVAPALPVITQAPSMEEYEMRRRQASMDLASLGKVLLTGVPPSILALALTNVDAVSKLLWSEFLDSNTPSWFTALPSDVQQYLSGEFGPSTARSASASTTPASSSATATSSGPSASSTALNNQAQNSDSNQHSGIPLWAKIVIGILVPLLVLGLIALLILCCIHRRRDKKRQRRLNPPVEQHAPLRGGYLSQPGSRHPVQTPHSSSSHHHSSSDDFRTPIGGTSYENLPPAAAVAGNRHSHHDSNQSLGSSRHSRSHPVPEPIYDQHLHHGGGMGMAGAIPLPPRSTRRSRDLSQDSTLNSTSPTTTHSSNERHVSPLNPAYGEGSGAIHHTTNPYAAGGSNLHTNSQSQYQPYNANSYQAHGGNPFSDPDSPRRGYMTGNRPNPPRNQEHELFLSGHGSGARHTQPQRTRTQTQEQNEEWPLRAVNESGYRNPNPASRQVARKNSWSRGDDRLVYEM